MALSSNQEKILSWVAAVFVAVGFIRLLFWALGVALSFAFIMGKIVLFLIMLVVITLPAYVFINRFFFKKSR
jgi:fatty acid desaturase